MDDPFFHHPELRGLITPAEQSFFRSFRPSDIDPILDARNPKDIIRTPDDEREAMRRVRLAGREGQDLWVFAYGSLMWDPAIHFAEVRRAFLPGYARKFCLHDTLGRGSVETPGLMGGIIAGEGCEGLVLRIAAEAVEVESEVIWRREMIFPGYLAEFHEVRTDHGPVEALCFIADPADPDTLCDLSLAETAARLACATGILGTNRDYLENTARHLQVLGIHDPEIAGLLEAVRAIAPAA